MALLGVVAFALIGVKLAPLFMPRSWRMKRMAKKAGLPPPEAPQKKKKVKSAPSGTAPQPASPESPPEEVPQPASYDASSIDERISEAYEIIMEVGESIEGEVKTPFMKYVPVKKEEEKPSLQVSVSGVLWDIEEPLVIINGKIYTVGDKVEDVMVVEKIAPGRKRIKVLVGQ